jgi:antitoxin component YwqK of YwqJK toxin-antitoxin module
MKDENVRKMFRRFQKKTVVKNPRNGKWKEFSKQAVLIAEGHYLQDAKHGQWKQYYETGELLIEETYDKGILHGRYSSYHPNGRLFSEGIYKHGKREGYFNVYDEEGKPVKRLLFVNNILVEEIDMSRIPVHRQPVESAGL